MLIPLMVNEQDCNGCRICYENCPTGSIEMVNGHAVIHEGCVDCTSCLRSCAMDAIVRTGVHDQTAIRCSSCPVACMIPRGLTGSCGRFLNTGTELMRNTPFHVTSSENLAINSLTGLPCRPLITGIGAGSNLLTTSPARLIVQAPVAGIDVVTAASEVVLASTAVEVIIDTDYYLGKEGAPVKRHGKTIGHVCRVGQASRVLSIGGAEQYAGKNGHLAARTVSDIANRIPVELEIDLGTRVIVAVGQPPVINGQIVERARPGTGSAVAELFARDLARVVDECIILDFAVTATLTGHAQVPDDTFPAGRSYSGVVPVGKRSAPGRYFGKPGKGWGGSNVTDPRDAFARIDRKEARPGARVLVTEPTGERAAYFVLDEDLEPVPAPIPIEVQAVLDKMKAACRPACVSALYHAEIGDDPLATVSSNFGEVRRAVRDGKVLLTSGGAQAHIAPGTGISMSVDVSAAPQGAFTWVPLPAAVMPLEFTMTRDTFDRLHGHEDSVRELSGILALKNYTVIS